MNGSVMWENDPIGGQMKLNNLLRVVSSLMQNIGCHKHAFTWYWGLPHAKLEQHSSPTQNTNIQIYDLFFLHYLQCVADTGKIDDSFDSELTIYILWKVKPN